MPTIKMKKGYPTSDGEMHDKHVDAVKAQVSINMGYAIKVAEEAAEDGKVNIVRFLALNQEVVRDYMKYGVEELKPLTKKKTTTKKPAAAAGK